MADNTQITAGSGTYVATDDVGGIQYQRVKISQGADGSATDVSTSAPLQVSLANTGINSNAIAVSFTSGAVTQSGNWTTRAVGSTGATIDGTVGAGTAPANMLVGGSVYRSTEAAPTDTQSMALQADSKGRLKTTLRDAAGNDRGANVNASNQLETNVGAINGATPLMGAGNTGTGSHRVTLATDQAAIATWGKGATGSAVPSGAQYGGHIATVALPTAATTGNLVGTMSDKFGRQIFIPQTVRDLIGTQTTTISASTTETVIVTGAASVFNDVMMLIISNTSAATNTRVDIRDATGGSVLFSLQSNGGQPPIGFSLGGAAIPQVTAGSSWTATAATATTDLRVYAVYAKNR